MFCRSVTLEWSRLVPGRCYNKKWTNSENCYEQRENTHTLRWKGLFLLNFLRCWWLENGFWIVALLPFLLDDLNLPKHTWTCKKEAGVITCWESHLYILQNATAPGGLCWGRLTVVFANISKGKVTATTEYLKHGMQTQWLPQKTNTSSVSCNKHGYSDKKGIASAWWTDRVHDPCLELSLKRICVLACHLLLFIPLGYFCYP